MISSALFFTALTSGLVASGPTPRTQGQAGLSLIPLPSSVVRGAGSFVLDSETKIVASGEFRGVGETLRAELQPATGLRLPVVGKGQKNVIILEGLALTKGDSNPEQYRLLVDPAKRVIRIAGLTPAGVFDGVQTLRQLLPTAIFAKGLQRGVIWSVPEVKIFDEPRFFWRGAHLDVCRHFFPKSEVLKYLDAMAVHKLNVFHFHLTEDQGWRIEIKKFPKLTSVGSLRKESQIGHYEDNTFDGKPYGGYFTQKDIREIVAYAKKLFITVVPEIEMPGHSSAAVASYPELGNLSHSVEVRTRWGASNDIYNVEPATIQFNKDVLTEVLGLFPSQFIHIGGDEVDFKFWHNNPKAQARMKELGLKNEAELQSWFVRQIDAWLASKNRRLVGWDEILQGGLAPGATVMSWRGEEGGIAAAKAGHDVVMTPGEWTYFDHCQAKDQSKEPISIGGYLPLWKVYGYDPVPKELTPLEARHVLGAGGQLWSEYIPTSEQLEYMAYPRFCALSEVLWCDPSKKDFEGFWWRLQPHLERLTDMGIHFRPLDEEQHHPMN